MADRQRLITITKDQVEKLEKKEFKDFFHQMIHLCSGMIKSGGVGQGERIASIQGPYKADDSSMLFVVNITTIKSGD